MLPTGYVTHSTLQDIFKAHCTQRSCNDDGRLVGRELAIFGAGSFTSTPFPCMQKKIRLHVINHDYIKIISYPLFPSNIARNQFADRHDYDARPDRPTLQSASSLRNKSQPQPLRHTDTRRRRFPLSRISPIASPPPQSETMSFLYQSTSPVCARSHVRLVQYLPACGGTQYVIFFSVGSPIEATIDAYMRILPLPSTITHPPQQCLSSIHPSVVVVVVCL